MQTEIGEYIVGAYLSMKFECDFVSYNVRLPGGKKEGLREIDVIGIRLKEKEAYLCEVTTHIEGLLYVDNETTIEKIESKINWLKKYAKKKLAGYKCHYMFWSPVVPNGYRIENLEKLKKRENLELIINEEYKKRVDEMNDWAKGHTHDPSNLFLRTLQILACLTSDVITLKGISPGLHRALKQQAERNRRSLNSEILVILENQCGIHPKSIRNVKAILHEAKKVRDSLGFTTTPEEIDAAKRAGRE